MLATLKRSQVRKSPRRCRPRLECLEMRLAPASTRPVAPASPVVNTTAPLVTHTVTIDGRALTASLAPANGPALPSTPRLPPIALDPLPNLPPPVSTFTAPLVRTDLFGVVGPAPEALEAVMAEAAPVREFRAGYTPAADNGIRPVGGEEARPVEPPHVGAWSQLGAEVYDLPPFDLTAAPPRAELVPAARQAEASVVAAPVARPIAPPASDMPLLVTLFGIAALLTLRRNARSARAKAVRRYDPKRAWLRAATAVLLVR